MSRNTSSIMDDRTRLIDCVYPSRDRSGGLQSRLCSFGRRNFRDHCPNLVVPSAKQRIRERVHHREEPGRRPFHDGGFCDQQKRQKSVCHQTQQRKNPQSHRPVLLSTPSLIPSHRFLKEVQMFEEVRDCPHLVQYYKCWQEDCILSFSLSLSNPF